MDDPVDAHVKAWTEGDSEHEPLGFILSMEGADPVLHPEQVQEWWDAGLRIIGPAHYGVSPYAHGTGTEGGLFPQGPALLKEMSRVGMILDVTHLSDQCFDEALDLYGRVAGNMRRLLEAVGLQRRARPIETLQQYLATNYPRPGDESGHEAAP